MHPRGTGFILNVFAVTKQLYVHYLSFLTGKGAALIGLKPVKTTADCRCVVSTMEMHICGSV